MQNLGLFHEWGDWSQTQVRTPPFILDFRVLSDKFYMRVNYDQILNRSSNRVPFFNQLDPPSSKYFGNRKCCNPQISDLFFWLVFFRESSTKIISKLTSRLPSCESSIPGRFALYECNSNDVRICKKISQKSCHQEIMKPKSDICGWQHLWGPKDLLNCARAVYGDS